MEGLPPSQKLFDEPMRVGAGSPRQGRRPMKAPMNREEPKAHES